MLNEKYKIQAIYSIENSFISIHIKNRLTHKTRKHDFLLEDPLSKEYWHSIFIDELEYKIYFFYLSEWFLIFYKVVNSIILRNEPIRCISIFSHDSGEIPNFTINLTLKEKIKILKEYLNLKDNNFLDIMRYEVYEYFFETEEHEHIVFLNFLDTKIEIHAKVDFLLEKMLRYCDEGIEWHEIIRDFTNTSRLKSI